MNKVHNIKEIKKTSAIPHIYLPGVNSKTCLDSVHNIKEYCSKMFPAAIENIVDKICDGRNKQQKRHEKIYCNEALWMQKILLIFWMKVSAITI